MKNTIKDRRIELGLTMKEVGDAVGVSEATVSRWESGDIADMKRSRIINLAEALKISPLEILDLPPDKKQPTQESGLSEMAIKIGEIANTFPEEYQRRLLDQLQAVSSAQSSLDGLLKSE